MFMVLTVGSKSSGRIIGDTLIIVEIMVRTIPIPIITNEAKNKFLKANPGRAIDCDKQGKFINSTLCESVS